MTVIPAAPQSARSNLRLALLALAMCAAALLMPSAGRAATASEYLGVNTQPLVKDATIAPTAWGKYFDQLQTGKLNVDRIQVSWQVVESKAPANGVHTYDWNYGGAGSRDSVDYLMTQLAQRGLRAAPLFATVPTWANPSSPYRMSSSAYPGFAAFIAAYAARYGEGGAFWKEHPELPSLPVYDYEIWTEANSTNFWTGSPNANEYAAAMKVISPPLHAAQPSARLLASIGWQNYSAYMDAFFAAGGGTAIDAIGYHPYAPTGPAIMSLVTGMRAKLVSNGAGSMPIFITESGQPVVMSGNGAASAGSGFVTDAARAATHTFTADALARSDCDVEQYLLYAITGSETNKEPIHEGYMGVFRHADGTPYITGSSIQRAATRWYDAITAGQQPPLIHLCDGQTTPDANLLPLGLVLTKTGATCVAGVASYDGNPLEGATIEFRATGRAYGQQTNAYGRNEVCLTNGPKVSTFRVFAQVQNSARSAIYECDLPVSTCSIVQPAPSGAGAPDPTVAPDPSSIPITSAGANNNLGQVVSECTWGVTGATTNFKKRGKRYVKVKARLACLSPGKSVGRKVKFRIVLHPKAVKGVKKKPKDKLLRIVKLKTQRTVTFTLPLSPKKGDRLILLHQAGKTKSDPLPKVKSSFTLKRFKH